LATARRFAAALGLIAFVFVTGFGMWHGSRLEWVLLRALLALILFSVLGFVTGLIGAALARNSAGSEVQRKLEAEKAKRKREKEQRERDREQIRSIRMGTAGESAGDGKRTV
jgi:hypothetical protein